MCLIQCWWTWADDGLHSCWKYSRTALLHYLEKCSILTPKCGLKADLISSTSKPHIFTVCSLIFPRRSAYSFHLHLYVMPHYITVMSSRTALLNKTKPCLWGLQAYTPRSPRASRHQRSNSINVDYLATEHYLQKKAFPGLLFLLHSCTRITTSDKAQLGN